MQRRCSNCITPTVNPAQCYKVFGVTSNSPTTHIVRASTAERKPYAFQRLFRSTNMRLGRVPFFLSSSQVWAGPPFRPFLFAAPLKTPCPSSRLYPGPTAELRLMCASHEIKRHRSFPSPNIPNYGNASNSRKTLVQLMM